MTMNPLPSPKSKFRKMGGDAHPKAEFTSKSEFNNMQLWLKRRRAEYETSTKKNSRFRKEVYTIVLKTPLAEIDE